MRAQAARRGRGSEAALSGIGYGAIVLHSDNEPHILRKTGRQEDEHRRARVKR